MPGAFRQAARTINAARAAMAASAAAVDSARTSRLQLADEFEDVVLSTSQEVATAATQLSGSAGGLSATATAAGAEIDRAQATIASLTRSSEQIQQVIALISAVAGQTRLLALNATIEAARAGEAGKGFAVVASEVKELADQTGRATEEITTQVDSIREVTEAAVRVMADVGATVAEMTGLVQGIAAAVDGGASTGGQGPAGSSSPAGLSSTAVRLRSEMDGFLRAMRD